MTGTQSPRYTVVIEHGVWVAALGATQEDRYTIFDRQSQADPVARIHLPHAEHRNDAETLKAHGWALVGEPSYDDVAGNGSLGRVEKIQPEGNLIDRLDSVVREAAGVSGPGESPTSVGVTIEYGVFEDGFYIEGPYYGSVGRTAAAVTAKVYSEQDGADGYEYDVKELCTDHEGHAKSTCEECNAEDEEEGAPAPGTLVDPWTWIRRTH